MIGNKHSNGRRRASWIALVFGSLLCNAALAHEGPPYPIFMDEPIPGYIVSVWADPDIGVGTFYVLTEPKDSTKAAEPKVEVWVRPVDGRLPKATYLGRREDLRNRIQFKAEPEFDEGGMWTAGVVIKAPDGTTSELTTEVKATPPGSGPWDLVIYLFPFVLFGGLWAMGLSRRWRGRKRAGVSNKQNTEQRLHNEIRIRTGCKPEPPYRNL